MVTFLDRKNNECCAPISGDPGPRMEVCGAQVKPGTVYCPAHYREFYHPVTKANVRAVKAIASTSWRQQRMTVPQRD